MGIRIISDAFYIMKFLGYAKTKFEGILIALNIKRMK